MTMHSQIRVYLCSLLASMVLGSHDSKVEQERELESTLEDLRNPDRGHRPGGLPMISDSAFSLLILIYVSIAFVFVFFMFCWKTESRNGRNGKKGDQRQCVLMTHSMSTANLEANMVPPGVISATPTKMSRLDDGYEEESEELDKATTAV